MKTTQHTPFKCWLWPDRTIGKGESRILRDEHNALIDSQHELLEALKELVATTQEHMTLPNSDAAMAFIAAHDAAKRAICDAQGVPTWPDGSPMCDSAAIAQAQVKE